MKLQRCAALGGRPLTTQGVLGEHLQADQVVAGFESWPFKTLASATYIETRWLQVKIASRSHLLAIPSFPELVFRAEDPKQMDHQGPLSEAPVLRAAGLFCCLGLKLHIG